MKSACFFALCQLRWIGSLVSLTISTSTAWAELPEAHPPVVRFASDIDAYPQNFAIAADEAGFVYVGNLEGVQIFDGETWQALPLPNGELVRSLEFDGDSRVYVGGFDEFGYVERTPEGGFHFESLSSHFSEALDGESFWDIWEVNVSSFGVFFVGVEHLFRFNPKTGETALWRHDGSFGPISEWDDKVYLQWRGEGLKSFDGLAWTLHPHPALELDLLSSLLPLNDELLVVNNDGPWLRFRDKEFTAVSGSLDIPLRESMTSGFVVRDELIGMATLVGDIIFYDLGTGSSRQIRVSNGFISDLVITSTGNILSVDDLGFSSVAWPASWQVIDDSSDLSGSVGLIRAEGEQSYVLSSSGVFASGPGDKRFRRLSWTDDEAWDLLALDSGERLLADSYEIQLISPNGEVSSLDNDTSPRLLVASRFDSDLVYAGTEYGVQVLRRFNDGWRVTLETEEMGNLTVGTIVEHAPGDLLIGSGRDGIHRLRIDEQNEHIEAMPLGEAHGLLYEDRIEGSAVYAIDGELLASTDRGLFRFDGERFERHRIGNSETIEVPGRTLSLATNGDQLWAFYYNRLFRLDASKRWVEEDITIFGNGAINTIAFQQDRVLVGGNGMILAYDPGAASRDRQPGQLKLTRAEISSSGRESEQLPLDALQMSTADERLTVHFALTDFERPDAVRYRTRLEPLESRFSTWSHASQQSFLDLRPGDYRLFIEANSSGHEPINLELPLTVHPQWHEAAMFRAPTTVVALMMLFLAARYMGYRRARLLEQENVRLEQRVAERTRELESANQQLDRMAHLDGLTKIPNRRRLDSYLEEVRSKCIKRGRSLAVALFDVDYFKRYNDSFGHQQGDTLLIELAGLLSHNLRRAEDLVARYGGEEFLVVLPGADLASARDAVESMRRHVERSDLGVTVSVGLHVEIPTEETTVRTMVEKADQALYRAKNGGRNQVVVG